MTAPIGQAPDISADHQSLANAIRFLSIDAVEKAKSGHPGMPMGMADVATVLYSRFLKHDPDAPHWPDRDRFVLSAGHGSMLLYSLLHLTGYHDITRDELKNFRQLGARTAGHPEYGHADGIETTTGPLGQGIANAVGMALAERMMNARFGDDLVDHHTYTIAGDGCLMEGISHEAASLAGHLELSRLIVLFDDNGISIDGPTSLSVSEDTQARFKAYGWDVDAVDGHDPEAVAAAIARARTSDKPSLIACRTTIGFGSPNKGGKSSSHGAPLGGDEIALVREALDWPHAPFEIPDEIASSWRTIGAARKSEHEAWAARHAKTDNAVSAEFDRVMAGELPTDFAQTIDDMKRTLASDPPKIATRVASQKALETLVPAMPELAGGSADLTGSNNTRAGEQKPVQAGDYSGSYLYFGVREHAMAALMNGMALHGGFVPYGGTFMVFTDYCRPSIRLSALMGIRTVYVMTHDSIGLGEDGPTHQPVEHLAALRAIPNLNVYRPCDAIETAECWAAALESKHTPSILALTRQNLTPARTIHVDENLSARGGYVIAEASGERQATLIATGSEVEIAISARGALEAEGIPTAVVSMPCQELFDRQDREYRNKVLGPGTARVAVEAGIAQGWERYVGDNGEIVAMSSFGASAPAPLLYEHFDITPDAVARAAKNALARSGN